MREKKVHYPKPRREVFEKEFEALADRVRHVKYRLEEERELLRHLMEANIWLSTLDRNEALLLHDARSIELSELDTLISKAQSMPGLQNRQVQPKPLSVKEEAKDSVPDQAAVSTVL